MSDHNTVYWSSLCNTKTVGKNQRKTVRPTLSLEGESPVICSRSVKFWMLQTLLIKLRPFTPPFMKQLISIFQPNLSSCIVLISRGYHLKLNCLLKSAKKVLRRRRCTSGIFYVTKLLAWLIAPKILLQRSSKNLKTCDPAGWHEGIQMITNKKHQSPLISAPGNKRKKERFI